MVHKCCISSCGMSVRVVGAKGLSYHVFPTKEPNRNKWVQAVLPHVDKPELFRIVKGYTRICSRHFRKDDYSIDSRRRARLSSCAVPSLFPRSESIASSDCDINDLYTDLVDGGASLSLEDSSLTIFDNQVLMDALRSVSEDLNSGTSIDQLARDLSDSLLDGDLSSSLLNMDEFRASLPDPALGSFSNLTPESNANSLLSIQQIENPDADQRSNAKEIGLSCTAETPKKRNKEESISTDSSPEPEDTSPNRSRKKSARKKSAGCFCVQRFQESDKDMKYYTGFTYDHFVAFFRGMDPYVENLKVTDMMHGVGNLFVTSDMKKGSAEAVNDANISTPDECKRRLSQGRSLSRMDEMFMTIIRLRRKIPEKVLGHMFCVSQPSVSRIVRAWTMLLSKVLELQPEENPFTVENSEEGIKVAIPNSFRQLFQSELAQSIISTGSSASNSRKTSSSTTCPNTSRSKRPKKEKHVVVSEQLQSSLSPSAERETIITCRSKKNANDNASFLINENKSIIATIPSKKKNSATAAPVPPSVAESTFSNLV